MRHKSGTESTTQLRKSAKAERRTTLWSRTTSIAAFTLGLPKGLPHPANVVCPGCVCREGDRHAPHRALSEEGTFTLRTDHGVSLDRQVHLHTPKCKTVKEVRGHMIAYLSDHLRFPNGPRMMDVEKSEIRERDETHVDQGLLLIGLWAKPKRRDEAVSSEQREESDTSLCRLSLERP